jgi:hypothetical protein
MEKKLTFGTIIFAMGLLIMIIFPVFVSNDESALLWVRAGYSLMGLGALIIIIFLILERVKDNKKFKEEFKEEDLRP